MIDKTNETGNFTIAKREDQFTGGTMYTYSHPCGFTMNFIPKPKFSKKFAGILVPFGSIHNEIESENGNITLPSGSAHYMEHCVFGKEENGGLLARLSSLGASVNAYTSNTHTMYYLNTVDNFETAFEVYLNAVISPYLGEDRIEAERNIIIQELDMYEDDPDSRCYSDLLEAMYHNHPVRLDIGGTRESVKEITSEHLNAIKDNYYSFNSISITIAGDIKGEDIIAILQKYPELDASKPSTSKTSFPQEPRSINSPLSERKMEVSMESFLIGLKNPDVNSKAPLTGFQRFENQKGGQLYLEMILGDSSRIFETLYSKSLINDTFGFHYICEKTYSYLIIGGESSNPREACELVYSMLQEEFQNDIDIEEFEIQKRVTAGNLIRLLDTVDSCGLSASVARLSDMHIFDYLQVYDSMDPEKIRQSMKFVINSSLKTESYVMKKGK
jgi:predicted Zn-dependent peptidase